jgi:hypothetical protein
MDPQLVILSILQIVLSIKDVIITLPQLNPPADSILLHSLVYQNQIFHLYEEISIYYIVYHES